ncbi:uncharacterized protein LOC125050823 [Pieris napi]|uniref:uncharacterized protein LOC125050823 n=1 Tax=Pieris napi TaxID=78633 RepID=UPI001FB99986|nr:uncharacterized protein LOC125050823 [Pieris napi]
MNEFESKKKKAKVEPKNGEKRGYSQEESTNKRIKQENPILSEDKESLKRKNFVQACKQVSYNAFLNYPERFDLLSLPLCAQSRCIHQDLKNCMVKQVPGRVEELFKIEMKSNMWYEALDICRLCITPSNYLSDNILKDIVEIILNAHEDSTWNYSMSNLLGKCQQILSLNFSMHPPCAMKSIRKCYINFLTSPMDLKQNTFTDRTKYESSKGIVKYCVTRLEAELNPEINENALFDKLENTPDNIKNSVQGLHWQKEKFEIFEMLTRSERIERIMTVLESLIELLQNDLAIWHSRYTKNLGSHLMRSNKPLMAHILWSQNILYTGAVTNNTRQILKLFVHFVHLQYPERHIKTLTMWLNAVIQTFYICENNSNGDYPNIGKYSLAFTNEFYKMITALPQASILRILERLQPSFMRYLISKKHLQSILKSNEDEIIGMFLYFIKNRQWEEYPICKDFNLTIELNVKQIKPKKILAYLTKQCIWKINESKLIKMEPKIVYPKLDSNYVENNIVNQNYLISILYIALQGFLDAYSIQQIQEIWEELNKQLDQDMLSDYSSATNMYSVSEDFVKKYRSIYQNFQELVMILHQIKNDGSFPDILKIFTNIKLLGL